MKTPAEVPHFLKILDSLTLRPTLTPLPNRLCPFPVQRARLHPVSDRSHISQPNCPCPFPVKRACLHLVGKLRFMSDINQSSLPTPFYSVLMSISVFMALSNVFHSINSLHESSLSHSILPVLSLPYGSFQLYISLYESLLQP